jgi:crotonobetainyl-CoA:carnitine CoA-transferase CaiB-like acyl-CoA transferase
MKNLIIKWIWVIGATFKDEIQKKIALKSRDEWDEIFLNSDVCYSPVLSIDETS